MMEKNAKNKQLSDTDIVGKSIGPALEAAGQLMRMRQYYSARQILHEVKKDLDRFLIHHPADEASDGI